MELSWSCTSGWRANGATTAAVSTSGSTTTPASTIRVPRRRAAANVGPTWSARDRGIDVAISVVFVVVTAVLGGVRLSRHVGMWRDEAATAGVVSLPFSDMWSVINRREARDGPVLRGPVAVDPARSLRRLDAFVLRARRGGGGAPGVPADAEVVLPVAGCHRGDDPVGQPVHASLPNGGQDVHVDHGHRSGTGDRRRSVGPTSVDRNLARVGCARRRRCGREPAVRPVGRLIRRRRGAGRGSMPCAAARPGAGRGWPLCVCAAPFVPSLLRTKDQLDWIQKPTIRSAIDTTTTLLGGRLFALGLLAGVTSTRRRVGLASASLAGDALQCAVAPRLLRRSSCWPWCRGRSSRCSLPRYLAASAPFIAIAAVAGWTTVRGRVQQVALAATAALALVVFARSGPHLDFDRGGEDLEVAGARVVGADAAGRRRGVRAGVDADAARPLLASWPGGRHRQTRAGPRLPGSRCDGRGSESEVERGGQGLDRRTPPVPSRRRRPTRSRVPRRLAQAPGALDEHDRRRGDAAPRAAPVALGDGRTAIGGIPWATSAVRWYEVRARMLLLRRRCRRGR